MAKKILSRKEREKKLGGAHSDSARRWVILCGIWLVVLVLWLLGTIVISSYLAPMFGQPTWPWFAASMALALGVPIILGVWLVRPLKGYKRAAWFTGAFAAVPVLAVLGFSAAAPSHTGSLLHRHGYWLFERLFGTEVDSGVTRLGVKVVDLWADLLTRKPKKKKKKKPKKKKKKIEPPRPVYYSGFQRKRSKKLPAPQEVKKHGKAARIKFIQRGGGIVVRAHLRAQGRASRFAMLLDTGATLTTISRITANKLGIKMPKKPIETEMKTATGRAKFPVIQMRGLRIDRAEIGRLTVAICDPCGSPHLGGVVGLNFLQHFVVNIDPKRRQLSLTPVAGPVNRINDIEPYLDLKEVRGQIQARRVEIHGKIVNQGPRTVTNVKLMAVLLDSKNRALGRKNYDLRRLPKTTPHIFTIKTRVDLKAAKDLSRYRLEVTQARW